MARGFQMMSRAQLSKFINDRSEYIKNLERILHMNLRPAERGDLNKTLLAEDADWRSFDVRQSTMNELNRQRTILLRATLMHEKMCPFDDHLNEASEARHPESSRAPLFAPADGEAQDNKNCKND